MKLVTARKDAVCHLCYRKIPKGTRYWRNDMPSYTGTLKEHTNCALHEKEPEVKK